MLGTPPWHEFLTVSVFATDAACDSLGLALGVRSMDEEGPSNRFVHDRPAWACIRHGLKQTGQEEAPGRPGKGSGKENP